MMAKINKLIKISKIKILESNNKKVPDQPKFKNKRIENKQKKNKNSLILKNQTKEKSNILKIVTKPYNYKLYILN